MKTMEQKREVKAGNPKKELAKKRKVSGDEADAPNTHTDKFSRCT